MPLPRIVSLFSGAGGLDLGFKEAGYEIDFALDKAVWAIASHRANFPETHSIAADLVELGPTRVVQLIREIIPAGESIAVIGGPPCQAFSRSNPFADVADPRNLLPMLYLDIVEMLQTQYSVQFVLFENVLGIRDTKHADTFAGILARLEALALHASVEKYTALDFAVPQDRQRVIISAFASRSAREKFLPRTVERGDLALRRAFEGVPEPVFYSRSITPEDIPYHPNHWTMRPLSSRFNPSSPEQKTRSFRRLRWDKPSPTVAYGHREIHVHPEGHRRLSIYEAMILQGFPRNFQLMGPLSAQVEQVSNAVPPPMAKAMALGAARALSLTAMGEQIGIEE